MEATKHSKIFSTLKGKIRKQISLSEVDGSITNESLMVYNAHNISETHATIIVIFALGFFG
jgi:hypothetical protein